MRIHKFTSTDAFVAIDLVGAETSSGPVRWARRVLQGGAKDLARSQTYSYAVLNMRHGGASAGISAEGPKRSAAIAAFVAEAAELVEYGTYLPDAAKGVGETDLAPLRGNDPRDTTRLSGNGFKLRGPVRGFVRSGVRSAQRGRSFGPGRFQSRGSTPTDRRWPRL